MPDKILVAFTFFLALFGATQLAAASAFDLWKTHCLAPVENVQPPETDSFERVEPPEWLILEEGETVFAIPETGFYLVTYGDIRIEPAGCALVITPGVKSTLQEDWEVFAAEMRASEKYVRTDQIDRLPILQSHIWREPVVEIFYARGTKSGAETILIYETDLEA